MSKDSYEIIAEEIKVLRETIKNLQRSSLNQNEAEDLNQIITKAQADMLDVSKSVETKIQHHIANAIAGIESKTIDASKNAAVGAIQETRQESLKAAQDLSEAAGEARKQAWRYFGGFWAYLIAVGALGAVIGAFATIAIQGRADAETFGRYTSVYCTSAGGTKITDNSNGQTFCAVPMQ